MNPKKELQVSAIRNGTVIDHIPSEHLFQVISILNLDKIQSATTFGNNLESKKLKRKAIIKVENKFFENREINKIALIAPNAKLNIIKEYRVVEKKLVEAPNAVESIVKCMNPKCITNYEKIITKFKVVSKDPLELQCHFCDKITERKNMEII